MSTNKIPKQVPKPWPDSDGIWVEAELPNCFYYRHKGKLWRRGKEIVGEYEDRGGGKMYSSTQEWLKCEVIVPEIEEPAELPAMVRAFSEGVVEAWWILRYGRSFLAIGVEKIKRSYDLTVIPNPHNDPELVRFIEEAKS